MRNTTLPSLVAAALLALPAAALAMEPKEAGEISAEIEVKQQAVKDSFGGRSWREMSNEERKDYEKKMNGARDSVLEEHKSSVREYETAKLKLGREGLKSSEDAKKGWADKKKAEADAKKAAEAGKKDGKEPEVQVQRGFDDNNPVDLEGRGGASTTEEGVEVQRGGGSDGIEIPVNSGGSGDD